MRDSFHACRLVAAIFEGRHVAGCEENHYPSPPLEPPLIRAITPVMDIERARFNMVEQQIRTWDVLDPRILDLIAHAPREDYVPEAYRDLAFADFNLPLGHGEVMMQPKVEARILQELENPCF